jgi:hypothetical protein
MEHTPVSVRDASHPILRLSASSMRPHDQPVAVQESGGRPPPICHMLALSQLLAETLLMATAKKVSVKKSSAKTRPATKAAARTALAKKAPTRKTAPAKAANVAAKTRAPKGKVWEYIKKNGLQDRAKRTMINADAKTKP